MLKVLVIMILLPKDEAARRCGFSISTLKRLEASGDFPTKVQVTPGRVAYLEAEVDGFIADRVAERDTPK